MPGLGKTLVGAALLVCATYAHAADDVTGVVVATDGDDLIVDIGSVKGATTNAALEIWRPIQVRHPVTGQLLSDRFLIGHLKRQQVRPAMALARADGSLSRNPKIGDSSSSIRRRL